MEDWLVFRIKHSQKNYIDLFCRQADQFVEVYITGEKNSNEIILLHDRLKGNILDLKLDQSLADIPWTRIVRSFSDLVPLESTIDFYQNTNNERALDFIRYHIGNSINLSFDNKGYSRFITKNIIGTWRAQDITLTFNPDSSYIKMGTSAINTTLAGLVEIGWIFNKRNFLTFLEPDRQSGLSMPVYNISEDNLILPGYSNFIFLIFRRESEHSA